MEREIWILGKLKLVWGIISIEINLNTQANTYPKYLIIIQVKMREFIIAFLVLLALLQWNFKILLIYFLNKNLKPIQNIKYFLRSNL